MDFAESLCDMAVGFEVGRHGHYIYFSDRSTERSVAEWRVCRYNLPAFHQWIDWRPARRDDQPQGPLGKLSWPDGA